MDLSGTLVKQVTIKSDGDVFYELTRSKTHLMPEMSPHSMKKVDLHDGEWGVVGSVIVVDFINDGKAKVVKEVIEAIDKEKKLVCYKIIGGDIMDAYKTFVLSVQVDTKEEENLVTWTFHYEKLNENVEDPNSLMDFCLALTKDIENYHLLKPN